MKAFDTTNGDSRATPVSELTAVASKCRVGRSQPAGMAADFGVVAGEDSYFGGKGLCFRHLINQIPPHQLLIVPFAGHCSVTRNLRLPARVHLNDSDVEVFRWWCRLLEGKSPESVSKYSDRILLSVQCGIELLETLKTEVEPAGTFVYCDPPYLLETRKSGPRYRCEMSTEDHVRLLRILCQLPCCVMISGYWSELYMDQLNGWRTFSFSTQTRQGPATEWVWCNYSEPRALQDYRWLGSNKRERFKLLRRERNLIQKLSRLPELERRALLAAVDSYFGGNHHEVVDVADHRSAR